MGRVLNGEKRRSASAFVVALVLLALVLVGADRAAAWATSRGVTTAVQQGGSDVVDAEVQIRGFPFLTQLLAGGLDHVSGSLEQGTFGGYTVTDVSIDAWDVAPSAPWRAARARADGVVGFDTLAAAMSERAGVDVTLGPAPGEPGALAVDVPVSVLGAMVDVTAVVLLDVVDGSVAAQVGSVSLGGIDIPVDALPGGVGELLGGMSIPVDLPEGVTLVDARGEHDGVRLTVEARDVALGTLAR